MIENKGYDPSSLPKEYSAELKRIIGVMLRKDPGTRPNPEGALKELLKSPLFNESRERFGKMELICVENRGKDTTHQGVLFDEDINEEYDPNDYVGETSNGLRHGRGINH